MEARAEQSLGSAGHDPILSWVAANSIVRHGTRGDIRLDKERYADKVDGIAALSMAMSRAIATPRESTP